MDPIFVDTETIGFYGQPVLIQYAIGSGPIHLHDVAKSTVGETMELIEMMMEHPGGLIAFNMVFDHFQLSKLYTTCMGLDPDFDFEDQIEEAIDAEYLGRTRNVFLKPQKVLDLMLHAQKGPYQSMMDRKNILIRRVPRQLAYRLADELNKRIKFKDIYFARRKEKLNNPWVVKEVTDRWGDIDPDFKNIELTFAPSKGLKVIAADALDMEATAFKDIQPNEKLQPFELGYAPCAKYIIDWKGKIKPSWAHTWERSYRWTWPAVYRYHATHWGFNTLARKYAEMDITILRDLYNYFGTPPMDDDDSKLSISVACCRWRGYKVNLDAIKTLHAEKIKLARTAPTAATRVRPYLQEVLTDDEQVIFGASTKKVAIEELAEWVNTCPACVETKDPQCPTCQGTQLVKHPAAIRATEVLDARKAEKEAELYFKLILAQGTMHPGFKIIGAKSSRMSGSDGFNAQGINALDYVRRCFPLAWDDQDLYGGDFDAFEVGIADAVYGDEELREELLSGRKIHGIFGSFVYPGETYDSILASSKTSNDLYKKSKSGLFAWMYAGTPFTLKTRLGIPEEVAALGINAFENRYSKIGIGRQKVMSMFSPLKQPKGPGSNVEWHDPAMYKETLFGFRRYFDIEFMVCRALYDLAQSPPPSWKAVNIKVQRDLRDQTRIQTASGAVQSALFGAAFAIQGACARAAINHEIQGSGAGVTKYVQAKIWDLQPAGVNPIVVMPMNIHDEIVCPVTKKGDYAERLATVVSECIEYKRKIIPLINMDWEKMQTWGGDLEPIDRSTDG